MTDFSDIQQLIDNEDFETARDQLRVMLQQQPDNAQVWFLASEVAVNDKQREHFLEKTVTLDPLHHRAANQLHQIRNPKPTSPVNPITDPETPSSPQTNYAEFSQRAIAFAIDFGLWLAFFLPIVIVITTLLPIGETFASQVNITVLVFMGLGLQLIYHGYFLTQREGQTLGKQWAGIRVVRRDGKPLTLTDAYLRSVVGYALSGSFFGAGFFWMLTQGSMQTWHDMVADTQVINATE